MTIPQKPNGNLKYREYVVTCLRCHKGYGKVKDAGGVCFSLALHACACVLHRAFSGVWSEDLKALQMGPDRHQVDYILTARSQVRLQCFFCLELCNLVCDNNTIDVCC